MPELPNSVRYIKNGQRGRWWKAAKENNQVHAGWAGIDSALLTADRPDLQAIEAAHNNVYNGNTQDLNALKTLLINPSQHIWVTFEDGCMWWCTVQNGPVANLHGESNERGHFWLECERERGWRNTSLGGRALNTANLPGPVTRTAGFKGTVCQPQAYQNIIRIIRDEVDQDAALAREARERYEQATAVLIKRLRPPDFELLIDLILTRTGWVRLAKIGGNTEGTDIEAENAAVDEIAFVQVKSTADQAELDKYVARFQDRRTRYDRMIFAVHTVDEGGTLTPPESQPVQVWTIEKISRLVVRLGLGEWVANRV